MLWVRTKRGMLVANLGAYRGGVERADDDQAWTALRAAHHLPNRRVR